MPSIQGSSCIGARSLSRVAITTTKENNISEPRINDRIRVPEVRLVGPNGEQVGIVRVEMALQLAAEADLDLVEVAPMAKPPVAKLMDFGKYKYEAAMKAREARKNQVNTVIKEIKLRPKIDAHDYGTKKGHVERFLKGGDKVKVTIMFRGREQSRPELGFRLLQKLAQDVLELGVVESAPRPQHDHGSRPDQEEVRGPCRAAPPPRRCAGRLAGVDAGPGGRRDRCAGLIRHHRHHHSTRTQAKEKSRCRRTRPTVAPRSASG
ncbi:initiation factor IF-3 (modular protein) [Phycicoccus elongatus Lp2]|uniref:Translation initiation factor IF-3 n=1 Tax=Phycicoccus elongatus Lp2 TaxID=1193181 RepID=N0E0U9_9MICO|nr:initiation factor IF-3 (modular protein) [Phycicoccus elongatus Lp2]